MAKLASSGIVIRRATAADAERIAEIYNEAIESTTATFDLEPKSVQERQIWLSDRGRRYPVLVGEIEGSVVGFSAVSPWSDRAAYDDTGETALYVLSAHQGRGFGKLLYNAIIDAAAEHGFHTLIARVTAESVASIRLHEAAGFSVVGTMKEVGHKFGRWLDVLIMQKLL